MTRFLAAILAVLAADCGPTPSQLDTDNPVREVPAAPYGLEEFFEGVPPPQPARVRLGRWLFYDTRLSGDGSLSCATCHRPEHAFSEPRPVAIGMGGQRGRRKTPSLVNLASRTILDPETDIGPAFFWDGRAKTLEEQVLVPIADAAEMGLPHSEMLARLSAIRGYRPYVREAFGSEDFTRERVAAALSDYVRTRRSGNAPYDQWAYGKNGRAMSERAQRGSDIFFFGGRCGVCHAGFNFSDGLFHNLGVGWNAATQTFADEGRAIVTGNSGDRGRFKTPGLRDVAKHAPYMHDGSLATLEDVVEFYNRGGVANPWRSARIIKPLNLTPDDAGALVEFLEALNGEGYLDVAPKYFPK
jgi:cytochrome c peroxidase